VSEDPKPSQRLARISARTGKPIEGSETERKPKRTDSKVFQAAERAAEFFDHLRTHYRETRRTSVEIPAQIKVLLDNGTVYDVGTATVKNISPSGALLINIKLPRQSYPVAPFKLEILMSDGEYEGIGLEAVPVRFEHKERGVGIKFSEIFVAA
jgi:hypothetical protein